MTVSGTWSRYRRARPPKSPRLGRWRSRMHLPKTLRLAFERRSLIILVEPPTRAELTAARRAAHSLAALGRAHVLHVPGAEADADTGDRNYLVLAKPNVIMNDIRLRGLAVAGNNGAGHKSVQDHAQIVRNLRRSLRNAAVGARLIQPEGLDNQSAADVADALADALIELHRLEHGLDRRIRREEHTRQHPPFS
jgi:hypothetical protein